MKFLIIIACLISAFSCLYSVRAALRTWKRSNQIVDAQIRELILLNLHAAKGDMEKVQLGQMSPEELSHTMRRLDNVEQLLVEVINEGRIIGI